MYALKLTYQLHGPDDRTITEGMVGVTMKVGYEVSMEELLARLLDTLALELREKLAARRGSDE